MQGKLIIKSSKSKMEAVCYGPNSLLKYPILLSGRVVSVATLPVMVSRLGLGLRLKSAMKMPWAASQNRVDPWNLAG